MRLFNCALALLTCLTSLAQNVSGVIKDKNTGAPVAYAHIYVEEPHVGTISNEFGEFEITLPKQFSGGQLAISHVEYTSKYVQIVGDTVLTIELESDIVLLDQVVVDGQAMGIAAEVHDWLKQSEPSFGRAFYRQMTKRDTLPTEWIEGFLSISYDPSGLSGHKIDNARFARALEPEGDYYLTHRNFLYLSLAIKIYSNRQAGLAGPFYGTDFENYVFNIESTYRLGEEEFVKVQFEPGSALDDREVVTYGTFIYNKTRKQLVNYILNLDHALGMKPSYSADSVEISLSNPKHTVEYQFGGARQNNLKLILVSFDFDFVINEKVYPSEINSKLIIFEPNSPKHKRLLEPDVTVDYRKKFEKAKYRARFWKDNPVVKLTPAEEAVIKSFEKLKAFGNYFKNP